MSQKQPTLTKGCVTPPQCAHTHTYTFNYFHPICQCALLWMSSCSCSIWTPVSILHHLQFNLMEKQRSFRRTVDLRAPRYWLYIRFTYSTRHQRVHTVPRLSESMFGMCSMCVISVNIYMVLMLQMLCPVYLSWFIVILEATITITPVPCNQW